MEQADTGSSSHRKEIPAELRSILTLLGRSLGTVSVYGIDHPSVKHLLDQAFHELNTVLQSRKSIVIGTFNGTLTIDEEPVMARDVPIRTLEKRLSAINVSHLALTKGLDRNELKKLFVALCSANDTQMKETLSKAGLSHVEMSDVKYVALRDGETTTGKDGSGKSDSAARSGAGDLSPVQVNRIVAFLKGNATGDSTGEVKKMLSDPERLGQMILEAASIRQTAVSMQADESLADIVIGCLRRTYSGLRKETEFQSTQGKVNLTKAMMLLEKSVLDKIHAALGAQHPEIDRRIFEAIRQMEEEKQFEMLTAHYFDQRSKLDRTEQKIIESIRKQGGKKAKEQFGESNIPPKDWQKLMVKAGAASATENGSGMGSGSSLDISALAVVLEKLEELMQIESSDPAKIESAVRGTRHGLNTYTDRVELRLQELESQIELRRSPATTLEDHAEHLSREELLEEVSKLTLSLLQPLTVVNASVEAALRHTGKEIQKELLDLAYEGGKRMCSLTQRLMTLVGYPVREK
jgi:hypothetical protein